MKLTEIREGSVGIGQVARNDSERPMSMTLTRVLSVAVELGASDVHLVCGIAPALRIGGEVRIVEGEPLSQQALMSIYEALLLNATQKEVFQRDWQVCFSRRLEGIGRFRISVSFPRGKSPEFSIWLC